MGWVVMRMERVRRTTPEEGGETVFPQAATRVSGPEWSECASKGLAVKTRRGDALLFYRFVSASPSSHPYWFWAKSTVVRATGGLHRPACIFGQSVGMPTKRCSAWSRRQDLVISHL